MLPIPAGSVVTMIIVFVILFLVVLGICILSFYARSRYGRFLNRYFTEIQREEIERQNSQVRPLILMEEMRDTLKTVKCMNQLQKKQRLEKLSDSLKTYTKLATPKTCVICYENLLFRTPYKEYMCVLAVCGHVFHFDCIWTWLNKDETCPMCRLKSPRDESSLVALTLRELQLIYVGKDSSATQCLNDEPSCSYSVEDQQHDKESNPSLEGFTNSGFIDVGMQTDSVSTSDDDNEKHTISTQDVPGKFVNVSTSTTDVRDFQVKEFIVVMPRINCSENDTEQTSDESDDGPTDMYDQTVSSPNSENEEHDKDLRDKTDLSTNDETRL